MAREPHFPGGAKHASHGATGLRAHASGIAAGIPHDDRLHGLAVAQPQQKFAGLPIAALEVRHRLGLLQREPPAFARGLVHPTAQRRREIVVLKANRRLPVKRPPERPRMHGPHARSAEFPLQRGKRQIVQRGRLWKFRRVGHQRVAPKFFFSFNNARTSGSLSVRTFMVRRLPC